MYCPKCGNEVNEHDKFCSVCGYTLKSNSSFSEVKTPIESNTNQQDKEKTGKKYSKAVAALLAFFLGVFGAHNFYLKRFPFAIAQLCASILSVVLPLIFFDNVYVYIISEIIISGLSTWMIVEFILILTDKIKPKDGYLE